MIKKKISRGGIIIIAIVIALLASVYAVQFAGNNADGSQKAIAHNGRVLVPTSEKMKSDFYDPPPKSANLLEIKEKMFVGQINDIYLNHEDYLGRVIKYQGIFKREYLGLNTVDENTEPFYYVIRYGPGCCGYDANVGFEVAWPKGSKNTYPQNNEWVEAVGILTADKKDSFTYLYVKLLSLTVMTERGRETVVQ